MRCEPTVGTGFGTPSNKGTPRRAALATLNVKIIPALAAHMSSIARKVPSKTSTLKPRIASVFMVPSSEIERYYRANSPAC